MKIVLPMGFGLTLAFGMTGCTFKEPVLAKAPPANLREQEFDQGLAGRRPGSTIIARRVTSEGETNRTPQNFQLPSDKDDTRRSFSKTYETLSRNGMACVEMFNVLLSAGETKQFAIQTPYAVTRIRTAAQVLCLEASCEDLVLRPITTNDADYTISKKNGENAVVRYNPFNANQRHDLITITNDSDPKYRPFPTQLVVFLWVGRSFSNPLAADIFNMQKDIATGRAFMPFPLDMLAPGTPDFSSKNC